MESTFFTIADNYHRNIEAIRTLAAMFSPVGIQGILPELLRSLNVVAAVTGAEEQAQTVTQMGELFRQLPPPDEEGDDLPVTPEQLTHLLAQPAIIRAAQTINSFQRSRDVLSRATLVMLVSSFELLVADILHHYFRLHPQALTGDEPKLSINQLKRFQRLEEVLEHLISDRVDSVLRGDVDAWAKFFSGYLGTDLKQVVPQGWDVMVELLQRRNLIVHNNGKVNSTYLKKAGSLYRRMGETEPPLGDSLDVAESYLTAAIDLLAIAGMIMIDRVWSHLAEHEANQRDELVMNIIFESVQKERWALVEQTSNYGLSRSSSMANTITFEINRWFALKRLGRWAEVADTVAKFDVTNVESLAVGLCIHALTGDDERFYAILPGAIQERGDDVSFLEWPIFEEMTSTTRFSEEIRRWTAGA